MSSQEEKGFSRRDFVKGAVVSAAAVAGAGALTSCGATAGVPKKWDKEADVVIAGFGGAGAVAALEATNSGAKALVLEKTAAGGGATAYSGGIVYAAGTSVQSAAGITDSADAMYKYDIAFGEDLINPDLVKVLSDNSAPNIEWLINEVGASFPPAALYMSGAEYRPEYAAVTPPVARGHVSEGAGAGLFKVLKEACDKRGIEVLYETKLVELVATPEREVLGVKAESGGNTLYIKAKKGVVLATGGFAANRDMLKNYSYDRGHKAMYTGPATNTGDGIQAACLLGAAVRGVSRVGGLPGIFKPGADHAYISMPGSMGAIYVNKKGERFTEETAHYSIQFEDIAVNLPCYIIFDEEVRKAGPLAVLAPWSADNSEEIAAGIILQAANIRDLAQKVGIDPDGLEATITTYNTNAEAGTDPEFGKQAGVVPLKTPPFYTIQLTPAMHGTTGGLVTDAKAQVLDVHGNAIPRLYAPYETGCGGVVGVRYPASGTAIAAAICFARIAVQNILAGTAWK